MKSKFKLETFIQYRQYKDLVEDEGTLHGKTEGTLHGRITGILLDKDGIHYRIGDVINAFFVSENDVIAAYRPVKTVRKRVRRSKVQEVIKQEQLIQQ